MPCRAPDFLVRFSPISADRLVAHASSQPKIHAAQVQLLRGHITSASSS